MPGMPHVRKRGRSRRLHSPMDRATMTHQYTPRLRHRWRYCRIVEPEPQRWSLSSGCSNKPLSRTVDRNRRVRRGSCFKPVNHRLRNQADTAVGAPEAPRVKIRILSDNQTLRDAHAAIDNDFRQPGRSADLDAGQYDGLLQMGAAQTRVRVNRIECRKTAPRRCSRRTGGSPSPPLSGLHGSPSPAGRSRHWSRSATPHRRVRVVALNCVKVDVGRPVGRPEMPTSRQ